MSVSTHPVDDSLRPSPFVFSDQIHQHEDRGSGEGHHTSGRGHQTSRTEGRPGEGEAAAGEGEAAAGGEEAAAGEGEAAAGGENEEGRGPASAASCRSAHRTAPLSHSWPPRSVAISSHRKSH
jgi:hypothetical protein